MRVSEKTLQTNDRGSAMVETTLVLPLYAILLFGIIFFSQSTLLIKRSELAAAYATYAPEVESGYDVAGTFFAGIVGNLGSPSGAFVPELTPRMCVDLDGAASTEGSEALPYAPVDTDWEVDTITEYLWEMALGEFTQTTIVSGGQPMISVTRHDDSASRYLNENHIVEPHLVGDSFLLPPGTQLPSYGSSTQHSETSYTTRVAALLNGDPSAPNAPWLQRYKTVVQCEYKPDYLRFIYTEGEQSLPTEEYLTMQFRQPNYTPAYGSVYYSLARASGTRSNARAGASALDNVQAILDGPAGAATPSLLDNDIAKGMGPADLPDSGGDTEIFWDPDYPRP